MQLLHMEKLNEKIHLQSHIQMYTMQCEKLAMKFSQALEHKQLFKGKNRTLIALYMYLSPIPLHFFTLTIL